MASHCWRCDDGSKAKQREPRCWGGPGFQSWTVHTHRGALGQVHLLTSHMPSFSYLQGEDNNSTGVLRFLRGKCVCNWQSLKECREWRKYIWRNNGWNFFKFTENYKCTDPGSSMSPKARNRKKAAMKPHNQNTTWWHIITKNSKKWYPSFPTGMILLSCMGVVGNRGTKNICVLISVCITGLWEGPEDQWWPLPTGGTEKRVERRLYCIPFNFFFKDYFIWERMHESWGWAGEGLRKWERKRDP